MTIGLSRGSSMMAAEFVVSLGPIVNHQSAFVIARVH
jgi:hypothetical protein